MNETVLDLINQADLAIKEERFDAKEKSKGSYQGNGGRRRNSKQADGRVVVKPEGGFDIKI